MKIIRIKNNIEKYRQYFPDGDISAAHEAGFIGFGLVDKEHGSPFGAIIASVPGDPEEAILDSFYVEPNVRGRGFGRALMDRLIAYLLDTDISFLSAEVSLPDDFTALSYLVPHGFIHSRELYRSYSIMGRQLQEFASKQTSAGNKSLFVRSMKRYRGDIRQLGKLDHESMLSLLEGPVLNYVSTDESGWRHLDADTSLISYIDSRATAAVLFSRRGDDYNLSWLDHVDGGRYEAIALLIRSFFNLAEIIGEDSIVTFAPMSEGAERIIESFCIDSDLGTILQEHRVRRVTRYLKI